MNKATPNSTVANPINSLLIFCGAQFKAFIMTSFGDRKQGNFQSAYFSCPYII
jgi:hypothetical protein